MMANNPAAKEMATMNIGVKKFCLVCTLETNFVPQKITTAALLEHLAEDFNNEQWRPAGHHPINEVPTTKGRKFTPS